MSINSYLLTVGKRGDVARAVRDLVDTLASLVNATVDPKLLAVRTAIGVAEDFDFLTLTQAQVKTFLGCSDTDAVDFLKALRGSQKVRNAVKVLLDAGELPANG